MAKIYESQVQWQSPSAHRFQAQPLQDYISGALSNMSQLSAAANDALIKIKDQEAASKMELADKAAKSYVENFDDYSSENYLTKMQTNAMKIWDDAFNSLDSETRTRFTRNNPEARSIFELKTNEAAVNKTFDHVYTEWDRRVPKMANEITALDDPEEIKAMLEATVDSLLYTSGMRPKDAEKVIDKLRSQVSAGAIQQMIGEGRLDDATALNNDLQFAALLTPSDRAKNNMTIQKLLKEKEEKKEKEPTLSEKQTAVRNAVFEGTRSALSDSYDLAKNNGNSEEWTRMYYKFLNDFQEGKLSDTYTIFDDDGNAIQTFTASQLLGDDSFALLTDMEYADRIDVAQKLLKAFEDSPAIRRKIGDVLVDGTSLLDSLPQNDYGRVDISQITETQAGRIKEVLDKMDENYVVMNDDIEDVYMNLRSVYAARQNLQHATLRPSNYMGPDDVVEVGSFLTNTENKASVQGDFSYSEMEKGRSGPAIRLIGGAVYSPEGRETMLQSLEPYWAYTNGGKRPTAGSNHMMIDMTMKALIDADDDTKKALGIYGVSEDDIIGARETVANGYTKLGIFDDAVGGKNALHKARPTMPYDSPTKWDEMTPDERKAAYKMYMEGKLETDPAGIARLPYKFPDFVVKGTSGFSTNKKALKYEKEIVENIEKGLAADKELYGGLTSAVDVVKKAATVGDREAVFGFDASKPIEETDYYASLVAMIKKANPNADPSAVVVRNMASEIRSINFRDWLNKVGGFFDWSAGASKYTKGTMPRETADSAAKITVGTRRL